MITNEITHLKKNLADKWKHLDRLMSAWQTFTIFIKKANLAVKNKLVKAVFKHNFVYSEEAFRTPSINDAFTLNYLNGNKKWLLFVEQPLVFSGQNPLCSPKGRFFEHLLDFLEAVEPIFREDNNWNCNV